LSQLIFKEDASDFQERITYFVDVIVPVPIPGTFTYRVPNIHADAIQIGCRVIVQFGRKKIYTGIIANIHQRPPENYRAKYIIDLLENEPSVNQKQIAFFYWVASYYMSTIGEVFNAALPSGLKLTSESFVQLNPNLDDSQDAIEYSEREKLLLESLSNNDKMSYDEISNLLELKQIHPVLKSLIQKESILLFEQVKDKFQPKKVKKIKLSCRYFNDESALEKLFESLEKKFKQQEVLLKYLTKIPIDSGRSINDSGILKSELLSENISPSSLSTLIKNEVFEAFEEQVSRFESNINFKKKVFALSENQLEAKSAIKDLFSEKEVVLLHGITGSGKTEIYIELIQEQLALGKQVLYLLPEIALTTQIVSRLMKVFGNEVGVFHSKHSDNERVEVWQGIISGKFKFVVGVRSAIFLPFNDLALIIVDEEHESSYKQYDPSPRYNARDSAIVLAHEQGAKVLLGTATPALDTYYNALNGKYGMVEMMERYGNATLPKFEIADMLDERKKKKIKGDFTSHLLDEMEARLDKGEQVILFQNRRGYSPYLTCNDCNHVPQCENCSVSLTYHMYSDTLKCHYCGFQEAVPQICTACGSAAVKTVGFGTEKLEEDIKLIFPQAKTQRMDQDTTRSKYSYQSIIDRFEKGETDVLIGTQMVSKGLDFDKVTLVGVFDFDRMIHFPDFRSHERAFQLVTQVSGRAGRKNNQGKVVIQTASAGTPLLNNIISHDYLSFYQSEIIERESFHYPPFYRLIKIILKSKDKDVVESASIQYGKTLKAEFGEQRILGPQEPMISRIRNAYLRELFVKIEKSDVDISKVKKLLLDKSNQLTKDAKYKSVRVIFDVDPL
jgi:primosomal protein N' (replication factor Y)